MAATSSSSSSSLSTVVVVTRKMERRFLVTLIMMLLILLYREEVGIMRMSSGAGVRGLGGTAGVTTASTTRTIIIKETEMMGDNSRNNNNKSSLVVAPSVVSRQEEEEEVHHVKDSTTSSSNGSSSRTQREQHPTPPQTLSYHHKSNSFHFNKKQFLDAFVAPPLPSTPKKGNNKYGGDRDRSDTDNDTFNNVYVVMVSFDLRGDAPPASCHFVVDNNKGKNRTTTTISTPLEIPFGGEIYRCRVPPSILEPLLLLHSNGRRRDTDYLPVSIRFNRDVQLTDWKGNKQQRRRSPHNHGDGVNITASLWPWYHRNQHHDVAVTNMNRNIDCGFGNSRSHCFHDWIIWHRNYGIEHFFIYENLSQQNHPWLEAAKHYVREGIVTLIDWPYELGGYNNDETQHVAMNHAMFAVASRVKWLGYFDTDEFFVPSSLMHEGNRFPQPRQQQQDKHNNNSLTTTSSSSQQQLHKGRKLLTGKDENNNHLHHQESYQRQAFDLLESFAQRTTNDTTSYLGIQIPMRNAQHPDYCNSNSNNNFDDDDTNAPRTTRLSRCTNYQIALQEGNPKIFIRVGRNGPHPIKTPHIFYGIPHSILRQQTTTTTTSNYNNHINNVVEDVVLNYPRTTAMGGENIMHLIHFAKHYGCKALTDNDPQCTRVDTLALSREVQKLEYQLSLLDQDRIGPCSTGSEQQHDVHKGEEKVSCY